MIHQPVQVEGISTRGLRIFIGLFLVLVLGALPADLALHAAGVEPWGLGYDRRFPVLTLEGIVSGESGRGLEKGLMDRSMLVHGVGALYREGVFRLFGRTNPRLVVGRDRWLFFAERTWGTSEAHGQLAAQRAAAKILEGLQPIREAGIPAVVMIVPNRSRTYADKAYPDGRLPAGRRGYLAAILESLEAEGVESAALERDFARARARGIQVFYRHDHHWTYRGAAAAAAAVADRIRQRWPRADPQPGPPPFEVDWKRGGPKGSLRRQLGFRRGSALDRAFGDGQPTAHFRARPRPPVPPPSGDRLALLGTSYAEWGFPEFLANQLGEPVEVRMGLGKGPFFAPAQLVAQTLNDPTAPRPRLVVWEIPEYHLFWRPPALPYWWNLQLPRYAPEPMRSVPFQLEAVEGLRATAPGKFTLAEKHSSFAVRLERPERRIRLKLASQRVRGRAYIQREGDPLARQIVIDGLGDAAYDFEVPRARSEFAFRLLYGSVGVSVSVSDVQAPR